MPRKTDKRFRLIEAAKILIHQQGFNLTTLADIAQHADVPLGNVYYYFKTKEAIGYAVIEKRMREWKEKMVQLAQLADPQLRLVGFMNMCNEDIDIIAKFGCSMGGLCQELGKQGGALADHAAKLLHDMLMWVESQWRSLGFAPAHAQTWAYSFIAFIQGSHLLTHTFKDAEISKRQAEWCRQWLENAINRASEFATSDQETHIPASIARSAGIANIKPMTPSKVATAKAAEYEEEYA